MAKILGIVCSHRYLGNCDILVKAVAKAAGEEHELELLRLDDFEIKQCRGCYKCTGPEAKCVQGDDLEFVIDRLLWADGVIIASPTYVRGPSPLLGCLASRVISIDQHLDELWKKPAVVIQAYGPEGDQGYAMTALLAQVQMLALDVKDHASILGALPGESLKDEKSVIRIQAMGSALFGQKHENAQGECPYCGSNLWRIKSPTEAECPICLTPVTYTVQNGEIKTCYGESPTQVFGYNWLNNHFRADLSAGVKDFAKTKVVLKAIRDQYKGEYTWLKKDDKKAL